ncbi:hypothetical protein [Amycolatopsis sp. 195334CR]|uniref:hypothetical protein n=1 Tax=Amycolatopsis sp. 195334CR TaxID=2814588 RepID=UPI001A8E1002|nr:hypothetical protein [Amycolatopsis sp. 195334CR]MBN6039808.1 hypothetical protein [Amycolatopsis sp. 195334CR]
MSGEARAPVAVFRYRRIVELSVIAVAVSWHFGVNLGQLAGHLPAYRNPVLPLVSWCGLGVITAVGGASLFRGGRGSRLAGPLAVVALACSGLTTAASLPGDVIGPLSWSWGTVGWCGLVLLLRRPSWALAAFFAGNIGLTAAFLAGAGQFDRVAAARFLTVVCTTTGIQLCVVLMDRLMRRITLRAVNADDERVRLLAASIAARQVHLRRRSRYAYLAAEFEPLLRGLADGGLDPADPAVQHRCALSAARMRRLWAETDETVDPLLHELRACADIAERRGVAVEFLTSGPLPVLPPESRRLLTEAPLEVLTAARTRARVTVLGDADAITLSVVADVDPATAIPPREHRKLTVTAQWEEDELWIEARWALPSALSSSTTTPS